METGKLRTYLEKHTLEIEIDDSPSSDYVKLRLRNKDSKQVEMRKVVSKDNYTSTDISDLVLCHATENGFQYI